MIATAQPIRLGFQENVEDTKPQPAPDQQPLDSGESEAVISQEVYRSMTPQLFA